MRVRQVPWVVFNAVPTAGSSMMMGAMHHARAVEVGVEEQERPATRSWVSKLVTAATEILEAAEAVEAIAGTSAVMTEAAEGLEVVVVQPEVRAR